MYFPDIYKNPSLCKNESLRNSIYINRGLFRIVEARENIGNIGEEEGKKKLGDIYRNEILPL